MGKAIVIGLLVLIGIVALPLMIGMLAIVFKAAGPLLLAFLVMSLPALVIGLIIGKKIKD